MTELTGIARRAVLGLQERAYAEVARRLHRDVRQVEDAADVLWANVGEGVVGMRLADLWRSQDLTRALRVRLGSGPITPPVVEVFCTACLDVLDGDLADLPTLRNVLTSLCGCNAPEASSPTSEPAPEVREGEGIFLPEGSAAYRLFAALDDYIGEAIKNGRA